MRPIPSPTSASLSIMRTRPWLFALVVAGCGSRYGGSDSPSDASTPSPEAGDASIADADAGDIRDGAANDVGTDAAPMDAAEAGATRLKNMTFEDGLVIQNVSGAEGTVGTPMISAVSPLKGALSLRIPSGTPSYVSQSLSRDEFFLSFYVNVSGTPADHTILRVHPAGGSSTVLVALKYVAGSLRLASAGQTFAASAVLLAGLTYRVGLHVKRTGPVTAEAFISSTNGAFGAPFVTSSDAVAAPAGFIIGRIDADGSDELFDDIDIDTATMPGPSP